MHVSQGLKKHIVVLRTVDGVADPKYRDGWWTINIYSRNKPRTELPQPIVQNLSFNLSEYATSPPCPALSREGFSRLGYEY